MKVILFACSESSALDIQTNRLSLFHVLDSLTVATAPFFIHSLAVVLIAEKEPSDPEIFDCKVEIINQGNVIATLPFGINYQGQSRCRALSLSQGMFVPSPSDIKFQLVWDAKVLSEWHIPVAAVQAPQQTDAAKSVQKPRAPDESQAPRKGKRRK